MPFLRRADGRAIVTFFPFLVMSRLSRTRFASRSSPSARASLRASSAGNSWARKASHAIRYQSVTGSNSTDRPSRSPCFRRLMTSCRARSRASPGWSGMGSPVFGVGVAGQDRPALGDDREDWAERADVEIDAPDALLLEPLGRLTSGFLHLALEVVPPGGFARSFPLPADEQDCTHSGVLLGLMKTLPRAQCEPAMMRRSGILLALTMHPSVSQA